MMKNTTLYLLLILLLPLVGFSQGTWTWIGHQNNNPSWGFKNNWKPKSVPPDGQYIIINKVHGVDPELPIGSHHFAGLTVMSGNFLTIPASSSLTITGGTDNRGTIVVESNSVGTGSFIPEGVISKSGTFRIERWLNEAKTWHLFSSPMDNEVSNVLYGHLLNEYDESTGSFKSIKDTDYMLEVADGYVAKLKFALGSSKPNPIVFSKNAPNNGDVNIKLVAGPQNTYFNSPVGFNLVGNPYPSNLDWKKVYEENKAFLGVLFGVSPFLYYYVDNGSEQGDKVNGWKVYDASKADAPEQYISIGQAFGVVMKPITFNMRFKNNQRTHERGNGFNKKGSSSANSFELVSTTSDFVDRSEFRFNENSTKEYDFDYDAYKLNSFADSPNISFLSSDGVNLSICQMPETESVDLGFSMTTSDKVTFSVDNVYDFTAIILEDKENGVRTDLMKDDYTFSYSIDDDQQGRFTIHFKKDVLSDDIKELDGMLVYSTNSEVTINTPSELNDVNVGIYDMNGQLMLLKQYSNLKEETIETNLYEGIYILKIDSQEGTFSSKLRLQN